MSESHFFVFKLNFKPFEHTFSTNFDVVLCCWVVVSSTWDELDAVEVDDFWLFVVWVWEFSANCSKGKVDTSEICSSAVWESSTSVTCSETVVDFTVVGSSLVLS